MGADSRTNPGSFALPLGAVQYAGRSADISWGVPADALADCGGAFRLDVCCARLPDLHRYRRARLWPADDAGRIGLLAYLALAGSSNLAARDHPVCDIRTDVLYEFYVSTIYRLSDPVGDGHEAAPFRLLGGDRRGRISP